MNKLFKYDLAKQKEYDYIIGTDEAGRGPGAGPVLAAAVCFKTKNSELFNSLSKLNDSKQLSENTRNMLFDIIIKNCIYSFAQGSVEEIEKYNILKTSLLMMNKSCNEVISKLSSKKVLVLVDGNKKITNFGYPQETIVKGDSKSASIAAASIIAKVIRDKIMIELDKQYPMYGWRQNKGYMTKEHLASVDKYGLSIWHRKKFFEKHLQQSTQLKISF